MQVIASGVARVACNPGVGTAQEVIYSGVSINDSFLRLNCRFDQIDPATYGRRYQNFSLNGLNLFGLRPTCCTAIGATLR